MKKNLKNRRMKKRNMKDVYILAAKDDEDNDRDEESGCVYSLHIGKKDEEEERII